jgi:hypothetical protein
MRRLCTSAAEHLLTVLASKVRSSRLLPDLTDVLLLEDVVLSSCSHQCRWPPRFYGRTLSRTVPAHWYRPAMQKRHKYWHWQNTGTPPRFHWFLPNFSSQYLCSQASYKKLVKAKSDHYHCLISVFLLLTSIQRPSQRSSIWAKNWGRGGLSALPLPPALISRWGEG